MADISMCTNSACQENHLCYRFTATPSPYWQSYCAFAPNAETGKCADFMPRRGDNVYLKDDASQVR